MRNFLLFWTLDFSSGCLILSLLAIQETQQIQHPRLTNNDPNSNETHPIHTKKYNQFGDTNNILEMYEYTTVSCT